jgi:3-deoxy-D-manno-octulosonate 8-phosphate phosphatase (KDO 8-P phosphatase)
MNHFEPNLSVPSVFVLDVDGVLTDGKFIYGEQGKMYKSFGPDDNDALKILSNHMDILFVTGDKRGFNISQKRVVEDMGFTLSLVSTFLRIEWIQERFNPAQVVYMGDGIFDFLVMQSVAYSIAPANADQNAKRYANYVTRRSGAERAVSEASIHLMDKFYGGFLSGLNKNTDVQSLVGWTV